MPKIPYMPGTTIVPQIKSKREPRTPIIYYGGKSRDADWILRHFPPHTTYIEGFGGGGAVILRKKPQPTITDIYNDLGNVSTFFQVLRENGEELYRRLYFTPYSKEEFFHCRDTWQQVIADGDLIEWARRWFVVVNIGYTHEEMADSFHTAKQVNAAGAFAGHVDDLPYVVERLRTIIIEKMDFRELIPRYDLPGALFYLDPPYLPETRVDNGNYMIDMPYEVHIELLELVQNLQSQVIISGYHSDLYDRYLRDWRKSEITHKSQIQNTVQMKANTNTRTEVLWIKEHKHGLWSGQAF